MKHLILIAFFCVVPVFSWSQASARIVKNKLKIGEQTEIFYELELASENDRIRFEHKVGVIPCDPVSGSNVTSGDKINLEIIGNFKDSIFYGKKIKWVGKYTVTCWDTGHFEIPSPGITLNDSTIHFQSLRFEVLATKIVPGKDIIESEIKFLDIPEDPFYWVKQNWWWMTLIIVIGAVAFFLFRRFRKKQVPTDDRKELSLKDRTLMAIDALDAARLWEKGKLKEHYIEMSYILRSYLGVRYNLNLLERTSFQTTSLLIAQGLSQDTVQTIQLILDQSDLVKFAKSAPSETDIYKISALAKQIVAETSPIEFDV